MSLKGRLLLLSLGMLPALGWAGGVEGLVAGHWDSVVLVAFGALIVWHEVNVARRGQAKQRKKNAWGALNSWRRPARSGWMPVLAKLASKRSRR